MPIYTNINNNWREINEVYVNVNNTWRTCKNVYIKDNNIWKPLLSYSVSSTLQSLKNDTVRTNTFNNVVLNTTITLQYNVVNNVMDGSDYVGIQIEGATLTSGPIYDQKTWKLGPYGGTYTLTAISTNTSITISIYGHGCTSATGNITYISNA